MHTESSPRPIEHIRSLQDHTIERLQECPASVLKATGHSEAGSCRGLIHRRHRLYWSGVILHDFEICSGSVLRGSSRTFGHAY